MVPDLERVASGLVLLVTEYMSEILSETLEKGELHKSVWEEISKVEDPELFVSIVNLGLVYDLEISTEKVATVKMTLTSMGCPMGPELQAAVHGACVRVEEIVDANVEVVWTPPWDPYTMPTEDTRLELGIE